MRLHFGCRFRRLLRRGRPEAASSGHRGNRACLPCGPGASGGRGNDVRGCCGLRLWGFFAGASSATSPACVAEPCAEPASLFRHLGCQQGASPGSDRLRALRRSVKRQGVVDGFQEARRGRRRARPRVPQISSSLTMREGLSVGRLPVTRMIKSGAEGVDVRPGTLLAARLGILLVGRVAGLHERRDGLRMRLRSRRGRSRSRSAPGVPSLRMMMLSGCDVAVQEVLLCESARARPAAERRWRRAPSGAGRD